jgi:HK97 family phage prohead protease
VTMQFTFKAGVTADGSVGPREIRLIASTDVVDRQGDVVVQSGIDTRNFMATGGPILWQHKSEHPIARCLTIGIAAGQLAALVQFPEPGISAKADEVYGLAKAKVVNSVSIGFRPQKSEPLDPKEPWRGRRFLAVELLEISIVSVPANPQALIVSRFGAGVRRATRRDTPTARIADDVCNSLRRELLREIRMFEIREYEIFQPSPSPELPMDAASRKRRLEILDLEPVN